MTQFDVLSMACAVAAGMGLIHGFSATVQWLSFRQQHRLMGRQIARGINDPNIAVLQGMKAAAEHQAENTLHIVRCWVAFTLTVLTIGALFALAGGVK